MTRRRLAAKILLWAALLFLPPSVVAWAAEAIPFTAATVTADGTHFRISWTATDVKSVAVYADTSATGKGRARRVGQGGVAGYIAAELPAAPRWYFTLVPDHGNPLTVADRSLHFATAPNFRDMGGYRTTDGRWVKMGLAYRSDQLNLLSDTDLQGVHDLNIRLICDLRTANERTHGPDKMPEDATQLIADVNGADTASELAGILDHPEHASDMGAVKMAESMTSVYRQLVSSPNAQRAYKAVFERLAHPENLPGLFHCTAGKDRTGWGTAVLLSILGVPRDTIMADYLASNELLTAKNARAMAAMPPALRAAMEPLFTVRAEYLAAAFDEVTKRYRSMVYYVRDGLGLDTPTIAGLKRIYLTE